MIEQIEALMPLLERLSDGALIGLILYMVWSFVMHLIWPVFFLVLAFRGSRLFFGWLNADLTSGLDILAEPWEPNDNRDSIKLLSDIQHVRNLMEATTDGTYIHTCDLRRATEILKKELNT